MKWFIYSRNVTSITVSLSGAVKLLNSWLKKRPDEQTEFEERLQTFNVMDEQFKKSVKGPVISLQTSLTSERENADLVWLQS